MADVEAGQVDVVVTQSVSRVSRSIRDLDRTVERIRDTEAAVHFVDEPLTLDAESDDPMQRAMFRLMSVFAELETDMIQQRTREGIAARQNADVGYHHGRPPLGFEKDDGQPIEGKKYHQVTAVLERVQRAELSKRQAARELDTSRPTITWALKRAELYAL